LIAPGSRRTEPKLKVVFVTDRNSESDSATWVDDFGAKLLAQWSFTCGEVHFVGDEARQYGDPYNISRISIDRSGYIRADQCLSLVINLAQQTESNNILVLIHGYNNKFSDSIARAVAFGQDLDFNGLLLVWCWPSEGLRFSYFQDLRANTWSTSHFINFFQALMSMRRRGNIDILAHSMGGHILLQLVSDVGSSTSYSARAAIFAAPDVDQADFKAREATAGSGFQTLYAFEDDWALRASKLVNGNGLRAGEGGNNLLVMKGIESVDAR
jgi:esterase/lipase superfamily enzyme